MPLPPQPQATPRPGERITGRYRVKAELGRGVMGVVLRARDERLSRPVALKTLCLAPQWGDGSAWAQARERFFRKARAAARLQHPHIVTLYDVGQDRGLAYMAMEVLPGTDLTPHTRAGQLLPPLRVLAIGQRVALALDHAHRHQVVHRDIKPSNIVVDPLGHSVKVTDFGIARLADAHPTRTGLLWGTPSYMAPEQVLGQPVSGAADLHALGLTLFQLLSGRLPFEAALLAEVLQHIVRTPAPDVRRFAPALLAELAELLARTLAKDPAQRPPSGQALAQALHACAMRLASQSHHPAAAPARLQPSPAGSADAPTQVLPRPPAPPPA